MQQNKQIDWPPQLALARTQFAITCRYALLSRDDSCFPKEPTLCGISVESKNDAAVFAVRIWRASFYQRPSDQTF
jgi:hypothetical protein